MNKVDLYPTEKHFLLYNYSVIQIDGRKIIQCTSGFRFSLNGADSFQFLIVFILIL